MGRGRVVPATFWPDFPALSRARGMMLGAKSSGWDAWGAVFTLHPPPASCLWDGRRWQAGRDPDLMERRRASPGDEPNLHRQARSFAFMPPVLATHCSPRCSRAVGGSPAVGARSRVPPALSLGNLIAASLRYHRYGDDSEALRGSPLPGQIRISEGHLPNISPPARAQRGNLGAFNLSVSAWCFPELSSTRTRLLCQHPSAVLVSCLLLCLHIPAISRLYGTIATTASPASHGCLSASALVLVPPSCFLPFFAHFTSQLYTFGARGGCLYSLSHQLPWTSWAI